MITKEYIDTTPEVQSLIAKLAQIPGVLGASADIVVDPVILQNAHPEAIMFYIHVPRYKATKTPLFTGTSVNLPVDAPPEKYQKLGFAMPPGAYLFEAERHPGIVLAMTEYFKNYAETGNVRTPSGATVPIAEIDQIK